MKIRTHACQKAQDRYFGCLVYNWQDATMESQLVDALFQNPLFRFLPLYNIFPIPPTPPQFSPVLLTKA